MGMPKNESPENVEELRKEKEFEGAEAKLPLERYEDLPSSMKSLTMS